jgi:DNA-binding CsgD family transcriptional regulator
MVQGFDTYAGVSGGRKRPHLELLHELVVRFEKDNPEFLRLLSLKYSLTATEIHICEMIRNGMKSKEIAEMLFIEEGTVSVHRTNIRRKLGLKGKPSLNAFLLSI